MITAANGGTSRLHTPNVSSRPSMGTPVISRRQSRQHTPRLKPQPHTTNSSPSNIPCPRTPFPSSIRKEQVNDTGHSPTSLSSVRLNSSSEHHPMLTHINPAAIHTMMPLFDQFVPLTSGTMQTDVDFPSLDLSEFPEFSLPLGDPPFPGNLNGLHTGSSTPAFHPSKITSNDTLPSLSRGSSLDGSSIDYRSTVEEHAYIDEVDESWPAFRCNPLKSSMSRLSTSGLYLDGLLSLLKDPEIWSSWVSKTRSMISIPAAGVGFESFDEVLLEKLTLSTQNLLYHAFDVHKARSINFLHSKISQPSGFTILPPAKALDCFLNAYVRHFETYNFCSSGGSLRPNWLIQKSDANLSSMLMLLMLAYGAAADSTPEARHLSRGLAEVCRISWQNFVEHDMGLRREPTALLSQLVLTTLQAWSGENSFMEVAMGQRDSYINVSETTIHLPDEGLNRDSCCAKQNFSKHSLSKRRICASIRRLTQPGSIGSLTRIRAG
jgi:hypothetical protein